MIRWLLFFFMGGLPMFGLGQEFKKYYAVVTDVNKPLSNTEFLKKTSTRGAKFIYREFINEKLAMGGEVGFVTYNDYIPPTVYTSGNTSIYTDLYSYVYHYSATLSGEYYFITNQWIMPYAGLGIGVAYNRLTAYYNIFQDEEKKWGALFRPNVGTLMRFGNKARWGATFGVHFDYSTIKSTDFDYKNFTNLGFQAGLMVIIR